MSLVRLSHVGFNVPRELFDQECEFWENVMGLTRTHDTPGRNVFFTADPLRDHELILYAVDGPVTDYRDPSCQLNHLSFDVATDAEVDAIIERLRSLGFEAEIPDRGRHQCKVNSPAGIHFEVGTPPYLNPRSQAQAREPTGVGRPGEA